MRGRSAWQLSGAAEYDALRDALNTVVERELSGGADPGTVTRTARLRAEVLSVDGFDRDAVRALRRELDARVAAFSGDRQ